MGFKGFYLSKHYNSSTHKWNNDKFNTSCMLKTLPSLEICGFEWTAMMKASWIPQDSLSGVRLIHTASTRGPQWAHWCSSGIQGRRESVKMTLQHHMQHPSNWIAITHIFLILIIFTQGPLTSFSQSLCKPQLQMKPVRCVWKPVNQFCSWSHHVLSLKKKNSIHLYPLPSELPLPPHPHQEGGVSHIPRCKVDPPPSPWQL